MFAFCIVSDLEVSEASVLTQFTTFSTVCLHDAKQEPLQIKSLYKHISHSSGGGTATHVAKLFLLRKSCVRYGCRFSLGLQVHATATHHAEGRFHERRRRQRSNKSTQSKQTSNHNGHTVCETETTSPNTLLRLLQPTTTTTATTTSTEVLVVVVVVVVVLAVTAALFWNASGLRPRRKHLCIVTTAHG